MPGAKSSPVPQQSVRAALRVADGPVTLLGYETDSRPLAPGRARAETELVKTGAELARLSEMLYADGVVGDARRILLVLQGADTSGKDGVVRQIVNQVGPAGVAVRSFKTPTPAEAAHHFLWRIRRALPGPGVIGVFNRSHYEDVITTRVHDQIDPASWEQRIAEINAFETELADSGTTILKCLLHIGYSEQRTRLMARLDDPTKIWKFNLKNIDERAYWSDYQSSYAEVIARTSTDHAPWYIVPSDRGWYLHWAITRMLVESLQDLQLSYPPVDFDVAQARARLQPPF